MYNKLSLRYRIALVIFILEACMLASVLGFTFSQSRNTITEFNAASQNASMDLLANLSVSALLTSEFSDFQLYIQDIEKQPLIQHILLANNKERIVASSQASDVGRSLESFNTPLSSGWKIHSVKTPAGVLGTLAVKFSDNAINQSLLATRDLAIIFGFSGMIIIALVGLATGFALTRRLSVVTEAARRFAAGEHEIRSAISGKDEVAQLSNSVNAMANAIYHSKSLLHEQNEYINLLLASTSEGIYGVDANGICTFVNPACLRMLGYKNEDELIGKSIHELIHHSYPNGQPYPKEQCRVRLATLQGQATHVDDEVHWHADGSSFPVEYWSQPMYRDGQIIGTVVTFVDISERKKTEDQIRTLAYFDPLTQLPNRRLLLDRLNQALIASNRTQEFGFLMILLGANRNVRFYST